MSSRSAIDNFSLRHISGWVTGLGQMEKVMLTRFYGDPKTSKRIQSWDLFNRLNPGPYP